MSKYKLTGLTFNEEGSFATINNNKFKINMDEIVSKIIEEHSKQGKESIINLIGNEYHKEIQNTGIIPNTVLLSEEYYGALKHETELKFGFMKLNTYDVTESVMGLKIKRCEGYNTLKVYKEII